MKSYSPAPTTSIAWLAYFEHNRNALLEIPWHAGAELTARERHAVARSLQEFQRGESSEGHHLHRYARDYAARTGDHEYLQALELFIAEEQRHARDLGRFLTLNGIPLVKATFTDNVFRELRHVVGTLEISIAVLITAEIIAEVYYAAIGRATNSSILLRLCEQIIQDERRHVQFQSQQLSRLRAGRGRLPFAMTLFLQRLLFMGACVVVWIFHRRALTAGGLGLKSFWSAARRHFRAAFSPHRLQNAHATAPAYRGDLALGDRIDPRDPSWSGRHPSRGQPGLES